MTQESYAFQDKMKLPVSNDNADSNVNVPHNEKIVRNHLVEKINRTSIIWKEINNKLIFQVRKS